MSINTTTIDLQAEVPAGWKLTGEHRPPREGEFFLWGGGRVVEAEFDFSEESGYRLLLERAESNVPLEAIDFLNGRIEWLRSESLTNGNARKVVWLSEDGQNVRPSGMRNIALSELMNGDWEYYCPPTNKWLPCWKELPAE